MNIQAEKLELVRMILNTDNPGILSSIKRIFLIPEIVTLGIVCPNPRKMKS